MHAPDTTKDDERPAQNQAKRNSRTPENAQGVATLSSSRRKTLVRFLAGNFHVPLSC
ncbi:hypothetical protein DWUX_967 [Desulfovibrio diazotrophicus]|nr:hypothetical protein DWUX_967 [Desulfovibrio diazotrophicus]VVU43203.1 hypothetical protein DWUX_549 [Desulfovibrio diazotrophicus]